MKACRQRNSGIGGQAVLEGVMMRNGEDYAIAVRRSDGSIIVKKDKYKGFFGDSPLKKIPFVRGIFVFIDSMVLGLRCTDYSASVYAEDEDEAGARENGGTDAPEDGRKDGRRTEEPRTEGPCTEELRTEEPRTEGPRTEEHRTEEPRTEEPSTEELRTEEPRTEGPRTEEPHTEKQKKARPENGSDGTAQETEKQSLGERLLTAAIMVVSLVLALGLFMVLPFFAASHVVRFIGNAALLSLFEGVIRIAVFVAYILVISQMKDIRRLFQYHGAEHKCINCVESGHALTVENAAKATRLHKRCGSSFILFVMMVSIVLFFFIRVSNPLARVGLRILLLPVISGISFELIRFAGSSDNPLITALSKPGLWLQGLTTKEPDEEMLAVAIESVNAVFDWQAYLEKELAGAEENCCE